MPPVLRRLIPLGLAGVLLACGGGTDAGDRPTAEPTATADATGTAVVAEQGPTTSGDTESPDGGVVADAPEALRFSAPLVGGGDIELTTLAGRPVLLWFWAPW